MKCLLQIFLFVLISLILGCSKNTAQDKSEVNDITPESIYVEAINAYDEKNYDLAIAKFEQIESRFPLSNEAIQAQIMISFVYYLKLDYSSAILKLDRIISRYPSYKEIDYAYYMKAMCYYEQIENPELDGSLNKLALENFNETINRFPNSKYARDSQQKIILIQENIAAKHMNVGIFYLNQKKYLAAMKRYQKVVDEHSQSKFIPEALHRLVEIYYSLGMIEDAKKTASVLGYNYPRSKWYEYSYSIVGLSLSEESPKPSLFKKILNKVSFKNEKN